MEAAYEDFEPFSTWRREQECDTLEIHVQGFKKQQLRVQINNAGVLKVSGEKPVNQKTQKRFYKEYKVPKDCDTDTIQAKFYGGILHIIMPKKTIVLPPQRKRTLSQQFEDENNQNSSKNTQEDQITNNENRDNTKLEETQNTTNLGSSTANSSSTLRKFAMVGLSVAMVSAIGTYIIYKYKMKFVGEESWFYSIV